jgi:PAS domain S-box-containing protein
VTAKPQPGPLRFRKEAADDAWIARLQHVGKIGAWTMILEDRICWWSDGVFDLHEIPRDSELAPSMDGFFMDGTADQVRAAIECAITTGAAWSIEAPFQTAKGRRRHVLSTGHVLKTEDGKTMLLGCFQDVTAFQKARAKSVEAQRFVESILDNLPHMVFVKDARDLRFVSFNKAGEALLGIPARTMVGKSDYDLFPKAQADFFVAKDRKTMADRVTLDIPEEAIDTPQGRRFLHTKKITVQDDLGNPTFLVGISEDITERKAHAETIERQRVALEHTARMSALGEMAGGIAHEINTPLAIIQGHADRLLAGLKRGNVTVEDLERDLQRIIVTTSRISKIVKGLRAFSRSGDKDPFQPVAIRSVVDDTLELARERFRHGGIHLRVSAVPDVTLECRAVQVSQTLLNLLNNAFDAVVGRPESWVSLEVSDCGAFVALEVVDSGPEISQGVVEKMMKPFYTTKPVGKGTGLGLAISQSIAEDHGGKLHYEARGGHTCFVLTLPKHQASESISSPAEDAA